MASQNFTLYRSSAGSGKTHTLVKEYLKLCLSGKHFNPSYFQHILAITFTVKAATEMKERITETLSAFASGQISEGRNKPLFRDILNEAQPSMTEKELRNRSAALLEAILHHYSDFSVCTIDSFAHRIIRTFARDLKIAHQFDVELKAKNLLNKAVDMLIDRASADPESSGLTRALLDFSLFNAEQEKDWQVEYPLKKFAEQLLSEEGQLCVEKLKDISLEKFSEIRKRIDTHINQFENSISGTAEEALELITGEGLTAEAFYQTQKGIVNYFNCLDRKEFDKIQPNSNVLKTIQENKWCSGKASEDEKEKIERIKDKLLKEYKDIDHLRNRDYSLYAFYSLVRIALFPMALLNEIKKTLEELKKNLNVVHISEFNRRISEVVNTEPAPFIYARLGEWYHHYLIDEFQDTSLLQWHNILPLIDNSIASGRFCMIVGDVKQSVYRWRNGEPAQMICLPKIYKNENLLALSPEMKQTMAVREKALENNFLTKQLEFNYRSGKQLVEFNNMFFSHLYPQIEIMGNKKGAGRYNSKYKNIYSDIRQKAGSNHASGYVQIELLVGKTAEDQETETKQAIALERTLEIINEVQCDGYRQGDIAVLCRQRENANAVAAFLLENGKDVVSEESLLLKNSPEVNFLLSCMRYLENPGEPVHRIHTLEYLTANGKIKGDLHKNLLKAADKNHANFLAMLKEHQCNHLHRGLVLLPLYELAEELMRSYGLTREENIFLPAFLNVIAEYSGRYNNRLGDFLAWWEENQDTHSVSMPAGGDAVQVMTIHKAKGLEFPVVLLPFTDWQLNNTKDNLWISLRNQELDGINSMLLPCQKKLESTGYCAEFQEEKEKTILDHFNLLYVAFTRPINRLYTLIKPSNRSDYIDHYLLNIITKPKEHGFNEFCWDEEKQRFVCGVKDKKLNDEKKTAPDATPEKNNRPMPSAPWRNRICIRRLSPETWTMDSLDEKRDYGNLLHEILSAVITADELEKAMQSVKRKGIAEETEKKLRSELQWLTNHPLAVPFFRKGAAIKTEATIVLPDGKLLRPDRIIIEGENATVVDYKTGTETPIHHAQINEYGEALLNMGYKQVEKYLVYVEDKRIVPVEETDLQ